MELVVDVIVEHSRYHGKADGHNRGYDDIANKGLILKCGNNGLKGREFAGLAFNRGLVFEEQTGDEHRKTAKDTKNKTYKAPTLVNGNAKGITEYTCEHTAQTCTGNVTDNREYHTVGRKGGTLVVIFGNFCGHSRVCGSRQGVEGIKKDKAANNEQDAKEFVFDSLGNREYAPKRECKGESAKNEVGSAFTPSRFGFVFEVAKQSVVYKVPSDFANEDRSSCPSRVYANDVGVIEEHRELQHCRNNSHAKISNAVLHLGHNAEFAVRFHNFLLSIRSLLSADLCIF